MSSFSTMNFMLKTLRIYETGRMQPDAECKKKNVEARRHARNTIPKWYVHSKSANTCIL